MQPLGSRASLFAWLLVLAAGAAGCKDSKPRPADESVPASTPAAVEMAAPKTIEESCKRICDRQTSCLNVPEFAAQCTQICRDQAPLPEQQKTLMAAHARVFAECFPMSCTELDPCFRRVIGEETARLAKQVGAAATIEITPVARRAFKELFCKIVEDSGGSLPNIADPNASPDIAKLQEWMKLLAQDPALMQQLLKEAEAECGTGGDSTAPVALPTRAYDHDYAFAFQSKLSLAEMLARLEALGYGQWHQRDKDAWGDYLFGRLSDEPYSAVAKLIVEDDRFVFNVKLRPDKPGSELAFAEVQKAVLERVLPALDASAITPTEYVE
jgi:hypothetical protein